MLDWLKRAKADPVIALEGRDVPVVIRRLRHARRMTMRLAPDGSEVRLSVPVWAPSAEALAFVRSRQDWLVAQLARLPRPATIGDGEFLPYRGEHVRLVHVAGARRRPVIDGDALMVGGPGDSLLPRLRRWMQAEAKALVEVDLAHYCQRAERAPPALALSNARRRWGSCSARGVIRINWRLVMAPDMVRRSVVAHEVAHLVHFDHSPQFHALLRDLFEHDMAEADRWLKREGPSLYGWFG